MGTTHSCFDHLDYRQAESVETHGLDCGPYERHFEQWVLCLECGATYTDEEAGKLVAKELEEEFMSDVVIPTTPAPPDGGLRDSIGQLPTLPATPEEFNSEMHDAQVAEFGDPENWQMNTRMGPEPSPVCAFPSLYFLGYVTVSLPQGGFRQEAPRYCGTGYAAAIMLNFTQKYFDADASMYYDWPQDDEYGGGYSSNRKVPWLKSGTKKANVGLMAEYYIHGYPPNRAMLAALAEFR